MMLGFFCFSLAITLRLGWLQLAQGRELAEQAVNTHSRTVYYGFGRGSEGRGAILDRNLTPFTEANRQPCLAVFVSIGCTSPDYDLWLGKLEDWTGLKREEIIDQASLRRPLLLQTLPDGDIQLPHWIKPVLADCDEEGNIGRYSYGDLTCHVLGFIQDPFPGETAPGRKVGRMGIERAYDDFLRTRRPGISAFVDGNDCLIPGLGYRYTTEDGQLPAVVLTLDLQLQQMVEEIIDDYIARELIPAGGAVVVMDPQNGHILAMASRPVRKDDIKQDNLDTSEYNRATRKSDAVNILPPASLIKLVTAAAALEANPELLDFTATCSGEKFTLGSTVFNCLTGPHGEQDLAAALANSCNEYFAALAQAVESQELLALAGKMGLGQAPDLGLPAVEVDAGSLPGLDDLATPAGVVNHFVMGSHRLEATPVQIATMVSTLANGGYRVEPRLVLGTATASVEKAPRAPVVRERVLSTSVSNMVVGMMRRAVTEGSARFFDKGRYPAAARDLAAKTGTSDPDLPPKGYQVRWSVGIYPWREPRFVIVYMAEVPPGGKAAREQILAEIVQGLAGRE